MTISRFIFASKSGRKISLEHASHPCPQCKSGASVKLTRSERQLILLNKRIKDSISVRYECVECRWKNTELPTETSLANFHQYITSTSYTSLPTSDEYPLAYDSGKSVHSFSSCHY